MNLRERVARNLRRLRQEKSVSQEELAHLAQVNRNYVGMLEREEYAASIDMLEKLALALDIDPIVLDTAMPAAGTKASSCQTIYRICGITLFRVWRRNVAESSIAGVTG